VRFLAGNIHYPENALKMGIQGRVLAQFIIDRTGLVKDIKVLRGIGGGCDEEAVRVIKLFPAWKPGRQGGKDVSVYFTLPVVFSLKDKPSGHQAKKDISDEDAPLLIVDQMPEYPGGADAMMNFLGQNIKYPADAVKNKVSGRVMVQFIVDSKGKIKKVKVLKGIGSGCDEEAVRVVSMFPDWKPGVHNGKPVSVYFTVPIVFTLK